MLLTISISETIYVLRDLYKVDAREIADSLRKLLGLRESPPAANLLEPGLHSLAEGDPEPWRCHDRRRGLPRRL